MIKKILIDKQGLEDYNSLSQDIKDNLNKLKNKLILSSEEYIVALDIASPKCKDNSCLIYYCYDSDNKIDIKGVKLV